MTKRICKGSHESEDVAHYCIQQFMEHKRAQELVEKNEEIWLDWDERETRKHARFTVFGNYKTPFCKTVLIPDGYCVGKCWRYPTFLDKED